MIFYFNRNTDPAFNLALEETLARRGESFLMLWRNSSCVVVGRNQNTLAEVDIEAARRDRVFLVRRMTGGGAVYHDLGNLNFTICVQGRVNLEFQRHAAPVVSALRSMGIAAEFSGRNDILVDGRKISGSASSFLDGWTLFHGTLLFDVDMTMLAKVLRPDPDKIRSKGIKSVRSRVANIREFRPDLDMDGFLGAFSEAVKRELDVGEESPVPVEAVAAAEQLADRRYRTDEWNIGTALPFSFAKQRRFQAGGVRVELDVKNNVIETCRISGDFFGTRPVSELEAMLIGCRFYRADVAARLSKVEVGEYIHGVTASELSGLFE
ncbi:MAG: lipoate--protein ligase [Victivallaceae bacterium]|nr:lipoate--protein ligase [Victivallaceae bacterium]